MQTEQQTAQLTSIRNLYCLQMLYVPVSFTYPHVTFITHSRLTTTPRHRHSYCLECGLSTGTRSKYDKFRQSVLRRRRLPRLSAVSDFSPEFFLHQHPP